MSVKERKDQLAKYRESAEKAKAKGKQVKHVIMPDGMECYLERPDRRVAGLAMTKSRSNAMGGIDVILENCWIDGDEIIRNDVGYLIGLSAMSDELLGTKVGEVKNF